MAAKRRGRKVLIVLTVLVLLLVVLVALLPTLAGLGPGQALIAGAISDRINGEAEIDGLTLSWFGDQSVTGLTVTDASGREAANLDLTLRAGLFSLLTGMDQLDVSLAGSLDGELRKDGSISFTELLRESDDGTKAKEPPKPEGEPLALPGVPRTTIQIEKLKLTLREGESDREVVLEDLTGKMNFVPGGKSSVDLKSSTRSGDLNGSISVQAETNNLFNADGVMTPKGATLRIDCDLLALPVFFDETVQQVRELSLTARSDDLTDRLKVNLGLDAVTAGGAGTVTGEVEVLHPFKADGSPNFAPEAMTGSVVARDVPTALLQPFLADTGLDLSRDLGRRVNADATFGEGQAKEITVHLVADRASANMSGTVNGDDGSIAGDKLHLQANVDPELVAAFSNLTLSNATDITVDLTSFSIPGPNKEGTRPLDKLAASGTVNIAQPFGVALDKESAILGTLTSLDSSLALSGADGRLLITGSADLAASVGPDRLAGWTKLRPDRDCQATLNLASFSVPIDAEQKKLQLDAIGVEGVIRLAAPLILALSAEASPTLSIDDLSLTIGSSTLAQGVRCQASASVNEGSITVDQQITGLFDSAGALDAAGARPAGTAQIRNLDGKLIASFLPEAAANLTPLLDGPVNLSVITKPDGKTLKADLHADGRAFNADVSAGLIGDLLSINSGGADLTVTPALAAALQPDAEEPIVPTKDTKITIRIEPFEMPGFALPDKPIVAHVTNDETILAQIPGLGPLAEGETVSIRELSADLTALLTETQSFGVTAGAVLHRPKAGGNLGRLHCDLKAATEGESLVPQGSVELRNISLNHLESMLGKSPGTFSDWLGATGDVRATLKGDAERRIVEIEPKMPNLTGRFVAEADEKTVSFTAEDSNLTLRREALQRILAPESDKPEDETSGGTLNVDADLPLKMRVKQCRLPKAIFAGEPIEPEQVKVDLLLTGGPLKVANADGEKAELDNLRLTVGTDNLADGVNFALSGKAAGGGQDASGGLQVNGNLAGLLAKNSTLDPSRAFVQMTADGQQVPTAIADMLGSMDGLLVAAVGPMMNIRATAENFSSTTGNLDFRVDTDNGWLEGAVQGKSHSLRIDKTKPVKAELALTEPLRERLLRKIHPLLGDIRSTEQPLRMTVPGAVIPIDGDVAKLRADLEITVGAVELDSGSTIFLLLSLAKQTHKATIKGHIDPINVAIRDGIETYRSFSVRLDKYTLVYSGQIDLIKGEVDLKTRIPLEGLAGTFQELEGYADKIVVPLVTRGKFGQLKTGVDPDFDLGEAAVQAGFNGLLDNVLKDTGLPIGDLLKLFDESKGKQDDK